MVGYTMAPGDVEGGLGGILQVATEKKPSRGWTWKVCGLLLAVGLCAAAALFFAWSWHGRPAMFSSQMQDQTEGLMEKQIGTTRDHNHTLKQIGGNAKAAIHLVGEYNSEVIGDAVSWAQGVDQTFAQGGLELKGNQIIIPDTGLYFVYSQASFRVLCNVADGSVDKRTPFSHLVKRNSDSLGGVSVYLLGGLRSVCQRTAGDVVSNVGQSWYNAVYMGAVFRLQGGDRLWTETNRLNDLETEDGKTFFGVFAL